jgi:hypothetical protein
VTTDAEKDVLKKIGVAMQAFMALEQHHPDDKQDFVNGVHIMQGLIMQRVCRRVDPENWPIYETKVVRKIER